MNRGVHEHKGNKEIYHLGTSKMSISSLHQFSDFHSEIVNNMLRNLKTKHRKAFKHISSHAVKSTCESAGIYSDEV
jgi:hypothetical protein